MNRNGNQDLAKHLSSIENSHRSNTLAIDLSTIYGRDNIPNRLEMFKFIDKQLGVKVQELKSIQDHPFLPQVFVQFENLGSLEKYEKKIQEGVQVYGRPFKLYGWRCDIPLTTVRISGGNPDTSLQRVKEVMEKYGKVVAIELGRLDYFKEKFISDGTWIIRMRPEQGKGLPSIIYYTDEGGNTDVWSVIFDGKVSLCYKCGQKGHRGDRCRAKEAKEGEKGMIAPVGLGTYCDIVKKDVNVPWQGMSNRQPNFNKQLSLKPAQRQRANVVPGADQHQVPPQLQQVEQRHVNKDDVKLDKRYPYLDVGLDLFCMRTWPKITNRYAALSETEADEGEEEIFEKGEDLMKAGGEKNLPKLKRKKSSRGEEERRSSPRLERDDEDTVVDMTSRPLDMTVQAPPQLLPELNGVGSDGEEKEEVMELEGEVTGIEEENVNQKSLEVKSSVKTAGMKNLAEEPQVEGGGKTGLQALQEQPVPVTAENEKEEEDTESDFSSDDDVREAKIQEDIERRAKL